MHQSFLYLNHVYNSHEGSKSTQENDVKVVDILNFHMYLWCKNLGCWLYHDLPMTKFVVKNSHQEHREPYDGIEVCAQNIDILLDPIFNLFGRIHVIT